MVDPILIDVTFPDGETCRVAMGDDDRVEAVLRGTRSLEECQAEIDRIVAEQSDND